MKTQLQIQKNIKTVKTLKTMVLVAMLGLTTVVNAQEKIYLGMRVPQMTTAERTNIGAETNQLNARGQLIFNNDSSSFQYWNGTSWVVLLNEANEVEVTGKDGTVRVVKDGPKFDLSVKIPAIADSLANYITNTILGDSILNVIVSNINNPTYNLGDTIMQYISNHFSDQLGDTILNYITNSFPADLGDTIINYITSNVTQELTDSVMAKVNITSINNTVKINRTSPSDIDLSVNINVIGDSLVNNNTFITNLGDTLVKNENFITKLGDTLINNEHFTTNIVNQISQNTNITQMGDSLAYYFSQTNLGDTILNFINNNAPLVKQATIAVDKKVSDTLGFGEFSTQNITFSGTTAATTAALKVVSIEPIFSDLDMVDDYLSVSTSVNVVGNTARWRVNIENRNIRSDKKCTLSGVVISYMCDDKAPLTNGVQKVTERVGF
jgi:hypothetical protein